jgi:hypothetical protein
VAVTAEGHRQNRNRNTERKLQGFKETWSHDADERDRVSEKRLEEARLWYVTMQVELETLRMISKNPPAIIMPWQVTAILAWKLEWRSAFEYVPSTMDENTVSSNSNNVDAESSAEISGASEGAQTETGEGAAANSCEAENAHTTTSTAPSTADSEVPPPPAQPEQGWGGANGNLGNTGEQGTWRSQHAHNPNQQTWGPPTHQTYKWTPLGAQQSEEEELFEGPPEPEGSGSPSPPPTPVK